MADAPVQSPSPGSRPAAGPAPLALDEREITSICAAEYGLRLDGLRSLGGEHAANARLRAGGGSYMFKAQHAGEGGAAERLIGQLEWQIGLIRAALAADPPLPVSRPLPTRRGRDLAIVERNGALLVVQISDWMPGSLMSDLGTLTRDGLRDLGATAGRLSRAIGDLPPPPVPNEHTWAFERMPESVAEALPAVRDPERRACAEELIGRFRKQVLPILDGLPRAVAHQDLNDYNVLMSAGDDDGGQRVTGIVDFDDSRMAPRMAEVAVAGAYAMLGQDDPLGALAEVVAGYRGVAELTEAELGAVLPSAAARLCVNAVVWTSRVGTPRGAYGEARMRRTWPTVAALAGLEPAGAANRLAP